MRFSLSSIAGLILVGMVTLAAAFTPPDGKAYGVTNSGKYWVAVSLVTAVDGSNPKLKCSVADWDNSFPMTLEGDYYTYTLRPTVFPTVDFCVEVGARMYIPDALQSVKSLPVVVDFKADCVPGDGGWNWRVKPVGK